jgi:hypothetical protein
MPHMRLLLLSTIILLLVAASVLLWFSSEDSSAIGSVVGGAAGMLAVLWFSASLYYQSRQLAEQREQFLENFKQLREDNRRNALLMVKEILGRAEERALKWNPTLSTLNDLTSYYLTGTSEWRTIMESTDAQVVLQAGKKWITMNEGPAMLLMGGIKSAAETYFRVVSSENIDYSMKPEMFVFKYGQVLWKLPFFEEYAGTAVFLSEIMVRMEPARASIQLAYWVAMLQAARHGDIGHIFREDKIIEDIKKHKEAGYPMPAIAKDVAGEAE